MNNATAEIARSAVPITSRHGLLHQPGFDTMPAIPPDWTNPKTTPIDFIIVGAGAGGAPLAARLVERGYTVLVTEMGPEKPPPVPEAAVFNVGGEAVKIENTDVPLLNGETSEDKRHSLRFFVKHFEHDPQQSRDPLQHTPNPEKTLNPEDERGIFYPRAQGVGGCTIHNAMITVSGPSEDWDQIAEPTGDESWRGERMRSYFERLERCTYNKPSFLGRIRKFFGFSTGWEDDRHGTSGWLDTSLADLSILLRDKQLLRVVYGAASGSLGSGVEQLRDLIRTVFTGRTFPNLDPNNWQTMRQGGEGLARIPCAITDKGNRSSARTRLLDVKGDKNHSTRLHLLTGVFVTKIEFVDDPHPTVVGGIEAQQRAIGIQYLAREHVYEADPNSDPKGVSAGWEKEVRSVFCKREVILSGGSFNTPQLLMLSGIGASGELAALGIPCRRDLPGVGKNLQDRYEVPVVATVTDSFHSLAGLSTTSHGDAAKNDPHLKQWVENAGRDANRRGLYATNGGLIGIFKRSSQEDSVPDLFIFSLAGNFRGYHVGYSKPGAFAGQLTPEQAAVELSLEEQAKQNNAAAAAEKKTFSWLLLKARTRHHGGYVKLQSTVPFRRPEINFLSFPMGNEDPDVKALVEGVAFVEGFLNIAKANGTVATITLPGRDKFSGVAEWVRNIAWGHHACGTCRIGGDGDDYAVLNARFQVRGVKGLRVVDASVFPRIPGFFIVTNVYMIAEKAADVLTEDHPRPIESLPEECRTALKLNPVLMSRPEFEARRVYPVEMEAAEAMLIHERRKRAGLCDTHPAAKPCETHPQTGETQ